MFYVMFSFASKQPRKIVFLEETPKEFLIPDDNALAKVCLNILRERAVDKGWNYEPHGLLTPDEDEFVSWYEEYGSFLPSLLRISADKTYISLKHRKDGTQNSQAWYKSVVELLGMPEHIALGYKVFVNGRYTPTSYYLLSRRQSYKYEGFSIVEPQ